MSTTLPLGHALARVEEQRRDFHRLVDEQIDAVLADAELRLQGPTFAAAAKLIADNRIAAHAEVDRCHDQSRREIEALARGSNAPELPAVH